MKAAVRVVMNQTFEDIERDRAEESVCTAYRHGTSRSDGRICAWADPSGKAIREYLRGMHGGCAYSLADTLSGIAASTYREYVTMLDASMNYLLPVEHTEYVYCKARVLRHGRKITVVR